MGPHLIVEVVNNQEREHNAGAEAGVLKTTKSSLDSIQEKVTYGGVEFALRGAVVFTPPENDLHAGHYRAVSLRSDLVWEVYDDLKEQINIYNKSEKVNVHVLLYTL